MLYPSISEYDDITETQLHQQQKQFLNALTYPLTYHYILSLLTSIIL